MYTKYCVNAFFVMWLAATINTAAQVDARKATATTQPSPSRLQADVNQPAEAPLVNVERQVIDGMSGGANSGSVAMISEARPKAATAQQLSNFFAETVLYNFCAQAKCADGIEPSAGVVRDASGNLYGTATTGGVTGGMFGLGCGTVFKLDSAGVYTVLHAFCSQGTFADGLQPYGGLIQDASGNLYGTTVNGGANWINGGGTIFKLDSLGQYSVLYSFCSQANCSDGEAPYGRLIQDTTGDLYGTTLKGGTGPYCPYASGCGTVFKLDSTGNYTVLYNFCSQVNCIDGYSPYAGLIEDASGNLYGTTFLGGDTDVGTVFKLDSAGNETVLYSFCSQSNCTDGYYSYAGLIQDAAGNLYGTTFSGGNTNGGVGVGGGTVFKLDPAANYTVLHTFCRQANCTDGGNPQGDLVEDSLGDFYGTTSIGGPPGAAGGSVFMLDKAGNYTIVYPFCSQASCADGALPYAGVITDNSGNVYGTTYGGGNNINNNGSTLIGVVFKLRVSIGTSSSLIMSPTLISAGSGTPVVVTATVSPDFSSAVPSGVVTFFNGSSAIGTAMLGNGVATFKYDASTLAQGSYPITASYGGDSTFTASQSSALTLAVTPAPPPDFSIGSNPQSVNIGLPGQQGTTILTISPNGGFNQTIAFSNSSCSGLPSGASCSFNPVSVTPNGGPASTTVTLATTAPSSANRSRQLGEIQSLFLAMALPGLLFLVPATSRKHRANCTIGMLVLGFLVLGLNGCGGGGGTGGGGGGGGTPPGTYTVTVTATVSGLSHATTITLTVK